MPFHFFQQLSTLSIVLFLTACGGGGGGNTTSVPEVAPPIQETISIEPINLKVGNFSNDTLEDIHFLKFFEIGLKSVIKDSDGNIHIFYGGKKLYHRYYDGRAWREEIIDDSSMVGRNATATIDNNGNFHILYENKYLTLDDILLQERTIKYAYGTTGSWEVEETPIPNDALESHRGTMAVDSTNNVYFAYKHEPFSSSSDIRMAIRDNNSWTIEEVVSDIGAVSSGRLTSTISIVINQNDEPYIFYRSDIFAANNRLEYAYRSAGNWITSTLATAGDQSNDLLGINSAIVDNDGYIHVCYLNRPNSITPRTLFCNNNSSGSWSEELVDSDFPSLPSIIKGNNGELILAYYINDSGTQYLRYARNINGVWNYASREVSSILLGGSSPLNIIDENSGNIKIYAKQFSNFQAGEDIVKEFVFDGVSWQENDLLSVEQELSVIGQKSSVGYSSDGSAHVVYIKDENIPVQYPQSLYYATNQSGNWVFEKLAPDLSVHELGSQVVQPKIIVDSDDYVHIVVSGIRRFGLNNNEIGNYYITNKSGVWGIERLPGEYRGQSHALALDQQDNLHIAYISEVSFYLSIHSQVIYLTNASGVWADEFVYEYPYNASIPEEQESSLAVSYSQAGSVKISFMSTDLMLAEKSNSSWSVNAVLTEADLPAVILPFTTRSTFSGSPSIEIDSSGSLHVAYENNECDAIFCFPVGIKYSTNQTGKWTHKFVDLEVYRDEFFVDIFYAEDPHIKLDENDQAYVAYYHPAYQHLRLAQMSECQPQSFVVDTQLSTSTRSRLGFSIAPSLTISNNTLYSTYFDYPELGLKYASLNTQDYTNDCANNQIWQQNINQTSTRDIVLTNESLITQSVLSVEIFSREYFSLAKDECTGVHLSPLDTCSVTLDFSPDTIGEYWDIVQFNLNDNVNKSEQSVYINLSAEVN